MVIDLINPTVFRTTHRNSRAGLLRCQPSLFVLQVADHIHLNPPVFFFHNFLSPYARRARSIRSLFQDPFHNFQSLFSPMMGRNFFGSMDSMMDLSSDPVPNEGG